MGSDFTDKESRFTGGLLGLIGINIVSFFVTLITIGFGAPAMTCYRLRWVYDNTVIDNKQLRFDGGGLELFGKYIKWFLLSIITIGIYSLWIPIKMQQWTISHVHAID
ncbi:MAG: DUF898 domain-containing protein [Clostridiales bacterium]|nr:DUF898 domain-containing protein [Clostridiales bacterium]